MRLIDADEAYKVLTENYHHRTEIQHEALKEALSKVPTVDAVKQGHWIVYDEGEGYPNTCECSNCGTFYDEEDAYCYDYCPCCGAKMTD